ncbi:MAG: HAMP domain-containing protein [Desulfobulbaceae bacterium]|nr:HAMP domain-containing protein [Desulfobulbaceae bacterium]
MNFIHTIKFRFTLWYLVVLAILLMFLTGGIYGSLSHTLYRSFDQSLRKRAEQLAGFRDIISIVAGGTFEEELGEVVSFYYYEKDHLQQITQHKINIDLPTLLIDKAFTGLSSYTTIRTDKKNGLRIFITPYTPINPRIESKSHPRYSGSNEIDPRGRPMSRDMQNNLDPRESSPKWDRPPRRRNPPPPRRDEADLSPTWQPGNTRRIPPLDIHKADIDKAVLTISRPINDIEIALDRLFYILCLAVPLTIVLAGGGGVFLASRVFRPIEKITETAKKIEESDLSRRIDVKSRDELGRLASTLNQMIARLESAFNRQKEFTSDASHELRAPLTVIQAESTLALQKPREAAEYRKSLEMIAQESEHLAGIINQLLTLARADAGKEHQEFQKINLADFVKDLCIDVGVVCQEKKLTLQQGHFDEASVMGDSRSLRNLFHNILENAMRYTPEGGTITVRVHQKDTRVMVSIKDTGIGISAAERSLIFERFYRVDKARSRSAGGSGLGLAICRHIIEVHGGSIKVESQPNKGSTFHVILPTNIPGRKNVN